MQVVTLHVIIFNFPCLGENMFPYVRMHFFFFLIPSSELKPLFNTGRSDSPPKFAVPLADRIFIRYGDASFLIRFW